MCIIGKEKQEIICKNTYDKNTALDTKIINYTPTTGAGTYCGGMLNGYTVLKLT